MSSLLLTKLRRPSVPPKWVQRPQLEQRLHAGLAAARQITLVSAPAGFGKTTCISAWLSELSIPFAWLSLDSADDEPGRFFIYLLAALQTVENVLGQEIEGLLRAGQIPPAEVIVTTLSNDILQYGRSFLLVLDDFQVIQDPFILDVMQQLVDNLPPELHLVFLTREDPLLPLARLRANNEITEIRAGDLRFSSSEATRFLNKMMGLSLSAADVAALEKKTEGWIVGLQLAALAMQSPITGPALSARDAVDPADFIGKLSGTHRHILSYLTEEVLLQQPAEIQHFLLQTSILGKLHGDLCNAVTQRSDSHVLLEKMFQANLFLIALDDEQRWYRYHQLFADLLRDRLRLLPPQETAVLHHRASQWYAALEDESGEFAGAAIQHALAAADFETAVGLIETHAMRMLMAWHAKRLKGWLQALPPEWAAKSPKTNLAFAWTYLLGGDYREALPYLKRLEKFFADPTVGAADPILQGEWLALQATLLNAQAKPTESLELANRALLLVPEDQSYVRSLIYAGLATAYQQLDDYENAVAAFQMIIQHGRAAGNLIAELLGVAGLGLQTLQHGQLHDAFALAAAGVERVEHSGALPPIAAALYGEMGVIQYHWHQFAQAEANFERSAQVSFLSGYSDAELYHGVIRSRLQQIAGNLDAATQIIERTVELMQVDAPAVVREEVVAQQVRIYLAQGRPAAAESALRQYGIDPQGGSSPLTVVPEQGITHPEGVLYNSALRVQLYRARTANTPSDLQEAIDVAGRLITAALQRQYLPLVLETLLLRAQMQNASGDHQMGLADVSRAVELAAPEGFISVFVEEGPPVAEMLESLLQRELPTAVTPDYVKKILAAFPDTVQHAGPAAASSANEALVEPLSSRELEILQLIDAGCTNRKIAERLVITLHTVKKHNSNIYTKLGVSSRTQAVARARQLGLL